MHSEHQSADGRNDDAMNDDDPWDAFLADEDQVDPLPEPGDFWNDDLADSDFASDSEYC